MTATWRQQFQPVSDKTGMGVRSGQEALGTAIISAIESKTALVAEAPTGTGKSFATLIPVIHAVKERKVRAAVSTETTALQSQLVEKDLPMLYATYGGFTFRVLKGRSWYFCLSRAKTHTFGRPAIQRVVSELESRMDSLGEGERPDLERFLRRRLTDDEWSQLQSETVYCAEAKCNPDICFSSRARAKALEADIVVTNHAVLRTDADMRAGEYESDGMIGPVEILVVDEAHRLEDTLIDGWKTEITPWGIIEAAGAMTKALEKAARVTDTATERYMLNETIKGLQTVMTNAAKFYSLMHATTGRPFDKSDHQVKTYYLSGRPDVATIRAMNAYEQDTEPLLLLVRDALNAVAVRLKHATDLWDTGIKGIRDVRKGLRMAKELKQAVDFFRQACATRDGIVTSFGVPYGVVAKGRSHHKYGEQISIEIVPLDVSTRAARTIFNGVTPILLSATLSDPIKPGDFSYVIASLGLESPMALVVESPFDHAEAQLCYVSPGVDPVVPVQGARFSLEEMVRVIEATRGRALVLFTANAEMEFAADELRGMVARGELHHRVLVQERGVDKQALFDDFKADTSSVLLASKSAFTGVDFPGETCSAVILAKCTLKNWNALTRQQVEHWRRRGFSYWYDTMSLQTFQQAVGRLIRAESDRGVVALLDQRLHDPRERVSGTFNIGIQNMKSRVTNDIAEVQSFLSTKVV